jgi:Na+/melibiose symporter-like transporter
LAALVIGAAILICCFGTLSRIRQLSHPPAQTVSLRETIRQVASTVTNPSLVALMVAGLIGGVTNGLNGTLGGYFYIYLWGLTNTQISAITFFAGLSSIVAVGLAPGASRRFGKKRSMLTLFTLSIFIGAIPLTLKLLHLAPPNGSLATSILLCADLFFAATLGVMGFIIISSMIADVVEDVAVRTGKRSEGLLFAANGLLPKLSAGVGAFLGGVLIALVGISARSGAGAAPRPEVMLHLALAYLPFSLVLGVSSLIALGSYKIDQTTHEANVRRLQEAV